MHESTRCDSCFERFLRTKALDSVADMENPSYYYSEDYDRIFQAKYIEVQKAILKQSECYKLGILISTIKYGNSTELEHGIDRR